jgi:hypothetical protein
MSEPSNWLTSTEPGLVNSRSRWGLVALAAAGLVIVATLVVLGWLLSSVRGEQADVRRQLALLTSENQDLKQKLADVSGDNGSSGVATLKSEITQLQSAVASLTQKQGSTSNRLTTICNAQAVSNEQSTLNGEATGSGQSGAQYYSDLEAIMSSICG